MSEGISGIVEVIKPTGFARAFSRSNGLVIKRFKLPTEVNKETLADYCNEVNALKILGKYKDHLSFSIPKLLDYGLAKSNDHIAYIEMTALANPLSRIDGKDVTANQAFQNLRMQGRALAELHRLPITARDQGLLTREPNYLLRKSLKKNCLTEAHKNIVENAVNQLGELKGKKVFIHSDFYPNNLFAESKTGEITGICDFCYSGIGVKEIDFLGCLNNEEAEWHFFDGYKESGGEAPNEGNLSVLRYVKTLSNKLHIDNQFKNIQDQQAWYQNKSYNVRSKPDNTQLDNVAVYDVGARTNDVFLKQHR